MSAVDPQAAGGTRTPGRAELPLPAAAASVSEARRFLRRTLREWDVDALEWPATQALSELVTNAVLHAGTRVIVVLELVGDGLLRLEVHDGSVRIPHQRRYGTQATTGRGIALVDGLSDRWGVEPSAHGKSVWCELSEADPVDPEQLDLSAFLTLDELSAFADEDRLP
jgi:anti-sigma regulatory factor (Ser/Thr protein kinase)